MLFTHSHIVVLMTHVLHLAFGLILSRSCEDSPRIDSCELQAFWYLYSEIREPFDVLEDCFVRHGVLVPDEILLSCSGF